MGFRHQAPRDDPDLKPRHEPSWRSVRCWTIQPQTSSRAKVAFPCGIACGLPAARISCASMIGSGISFVVSTHQAPRSVPLTFHPFPSRRSVRDSLPERCSS